MTEYLQQTDIPEEIIGVIGLVFLVGVFCVVWATFV